MFVILRFVYCNDESGAKVKEASFRVTDSARKGLPNILLKRSEELWLNLSNFRGHCNGANTKAKEVELPARFLQINSKALYIPCANDSLNLVVVDSPKSATEALFFLVC